MADNINFGLLKDVTPQSPQEVTTPALGDFLSAFKNGFVTADDISRRSREKVRDNDQLKTDLAAGDLKRKQIDAQGQLMPGDLVLARQNQELGERKNKAYGKELDIQDSIYNARKDTAERQARIAEMRMSPDPKIRAKALDEEHNFQLEEDYSKSVGSLPDKLTLDAPAKIEDYVPWRQKFVSDGLEKAAAAFGAMPHPAEDKATALEAARQELFAKAPDAWKQYATAQAAQSHSVERGSPEYYKELQKQLNDKMKQGLILKAGAEALPKIFENQAIGTPSASLDKSTVKRFNPKTNMEDEYRVVLDPSTGKVVSETLLSSNPPSMTENQGNAKIYSARMNFNNAILNQTEEKGFDPTAASSTVQGLPFFPNRMKGEDFTLYQSAKRNWISAVLRRESGAAISQAEFTGADKQYFPQDGDPKAVVDQKRQLRELAEKEMHSLAGPAGASTPNAPVTPAATATPSLTTPNGSVLKPGDKVTYQGQVRTIIVKPDGTFSLQ